jgi:hypothetical protein
MSGGNAPLMSTHLRPQPSIESFPCMIQFPFAIDMIDSFPRRKIMGQQSPLNTAFDDIENRVKIFLAVNRRSSRLP